MADLEAKPNLAHNVSYVALVRQLRVPFSSLFIIVKLPLRVKFSRKFSGGLRPPGPHQKLSLWTCWGLRPYTETPAVTRSLRLRFRSRLASLACRGSPLSKILDTPLDKVEAFWKEILPVYFPSVLSVFLCTHCI